MPDGFTVRAASPGGQPPCPVREVGCDLHFVGGPVSRDVPSYVDYHHSDGFRAASDAALKYRRWGYHLCQLRCAT